MASSHPGRPSFLAARSARDRSARPRRRVRRRCNSRRNSAAIRPFEPVCSLCGATVFAQSLTLPAAAFCVHAWRRPAHSTRRCSAYGPAGVRVSSRFLRGRRGQGVAEPWRAPRRRQARHAGPALHRHARFQARARSSVLAAERGLRPLRRDGGRPHRAMRAGVAARLARRRVVTGPARPTSIPARSASRSPIPGTTTAIRISRAARSRR